MPAIRRKAASGTVEAIAEDVRVVREGGGIYHADPIAFVASFEMLEPDPMGVDEFTVQYTRTLFATHIRRVCAAAAEEAVDDACARAAALSLRTIMLRKQSDDRKIASIRRSAQSKHQCRISLDGLRKREDVLLAAAASEIHEDLVAATQGLAPRTVEEFARHIAPDVQDAYENFDDGLRRIYRAAPTPDEKLRESLMLDMLYEAAHMQFWFRRLIEIRKEPRKHTNLDLWFADMAAVVMSNMFGYFDDREFVYEALRQVGRVEKAEFLQKLLNDPEGGDVIDRWRAWISNCHLECAYQRTYDTRLLCPAHQVTYVLYCFCDTYKELVSGELKEHLDSEMGV